MASDDRRPLSSRDTTLAKSVAARLAATDITPNQISYASMVMAIVALAAFYGAANTQGLLASGFYLLAALGCQLRLLCNLFDGMVAIEAGKHTADGAVWNEWPDRIADALILVGLGIAAGSLALGWFAASTAVFTAYVRELGKGIDGTVDFGGPMAKPQRMAVVTVVCVAAAFTIQSNFHLSILMAGLWITGVGSLLTAGLRTYRLVKRLRS